LGIVWKTKNICELIFKYLKIKDLMDGCIVGTGTDYVVIQKERKRSLIEIMPNTIKELKNASTPYGSQID
jgi:hypothetical protein